MMGKDRAKLVTDHMTGKPSFLLVTLFTWSLLSSCAATIPTYDFHALNKDQSYWFNYDVSRRGTILSPKADPQKGLYMCAEPSPDAALNTAITKLTELSASGKISGGAPEGTTTIRSQSDSAASIVELVSRTQTILFLREAMYRLCEQQLNGTLDKEDVKSLYTTIVNTSVTLAEAQVIETLSTKVKDKDMAANLLETFMNGQIQKIRLQQGHFPDAEPEEGTKATTVQRK
jgi:hypothetical protein